MVYIYLHDDWYNYPETPGGDYTISLSFAAAQASACASFPGVQPPACAAAPKHAHSRPDMRASSSLQPPPPAPPPSPSPPSASVIRTLALDTGNLGSGTSVTTSGSTAGQPDLGQRASPDAIFGYTAPFGGLLTVSICPSGWDSFVHVLDAASKVLSENDNATVAGCTGQGSKVSG